MYNKFCLDSKTIHLITPTRLNVLLYKYTNNTDFYFEEIGLFLSRDNDTWLAVDNCSEALLIEEFHSLERAVQFLLDDEDCRLGEKEEYDIKSSFHNLTN